MNLMRKPYRICLLIQCFFFTFKLAHGADPHMKNQEGQTSLDLATAEDVKCLLQDTMLASEQNIATTTKKTFDSFLSPNTEVVLLPTGASITLTIPIPPVIF